MTYLPLIKRAMSAKPDTNRCGRYLPTGYCSAVIDTVHSPIVYYITKLQVCQSEVFSIYQVFVSSSYSNSYASSLLTILTGGLSGVTPPVADIV